MTDLRVAIKAINLEKYDMLARMNGISEVEALHLCRHSKNVNRFVESFTCGDQIFIITKYCKGGNLLSYMEARGVNKLSEVDARWILK